MDEPCESFIEPAPKVDLIAIFERDGYLAYLKALPHPPPHPELPPSQFDERNEWGDVRSDPWWAAGDYRRSDAQGFEQVVGWGTGSW